MKDLHILEVEQYMYKQLYLTVSNCCTSTTKERDVLQSEILLLGDEHGNVSKVSNPSKKSLFKKGFYQVLFHNVWLT